MNLLEGIRTKVRESLAKPHSKSEPYYWNKPDYWREHDQLIKKWMISLSKFKNQFYPENNFVETDSVDYFPEWWQWIRDDIEYEKKQSKVRNKIKRRLNLNDNSIVFKDTGFEIRGVKKLEIEFDFSKYNDLLEKLGETHFHYSIRNKKTEEILKKYQMNEIFNNCIHKAIILGRPINADQNYKIFEDELGKETFDKIKKKIQQLPGALGNLGFAFRDHQNNFLNENKIQVNTNVNTCNHCGRKFYPFTLDDTFLYYYPFSNIAEIRHCSPCLKAATRGFYKRFKTNDEMKEDLRNLINVLEYIPPTNFVRPSFLREIPQDKFDKVMDLLIEISPYIRDYHYGPKKLRMVNTYKEEFGSWLAALIESGVLDEDARPTSRGTMCLAEDGDVCLSMQEKVIDDWLHNNGIEHIKEPNYPNDPELNPNGRLRSDWKVGECFIEFFGLVGSEDYDLRINLKKELIEKHKLKLIELYPSDINNIEEKLNVLK